MTNDRDDVKQPVTPVTYDRRGITPGIVHIGVGNFHRAHEAFYVDRLLRMGSAASWGISGIGIMPTDARMRDALRSQDLEYTLIERHPSGIDHATRIGAIVEYLYAPDELDPVLERLAAPSTRIVSLTITEGGYNISDATGEFDAGAPAVVADARPGAQPATVFFPATTSRPTARWPATASWPSPRWPTQSSVRGCATTSPSRTRWSIGSRP
jgi:mannitol 2-dehydrogenase